MAHWTAGLSLALCWLNVACGEPADSSAGCPQDDTTLASAGAPSEADETPTDDVVNDRISAPPDTTALASIPEAVERAACPHGAELARLDDFPVGVLATDEDTVFYTTDLGLLRWQPGEEEPSHLLGSSELNACGLIGDNLLCASRRLWTIPLDGAEPSWLDVNSGGLGTDSEYAYTFVGPDLALVRAVPFATTTQVVADLSATSLAGWLSGVAPRIAHLYTAQADNPEAVFIAPYISARVSIVKVQKEDGTVTEFGTAFSVRDMAADQHHVYWSELETLGVERIATNGSNQTTVSEIRVYPSGIDVTEDHVYWLGHELDGHEYSGALLRTPKDGGTTELLARFDGFGGTLHVGTNCAYWATAEHIYASAR